MIFYSINYIRINNKREIVKNKLIKMHVFPRLKIQLFVINIAQNSL